MTRLSVDRLERVFCWPFPVTRIAVAGISGAKTVQHRHGSLTGNFCYQAITLKTHGIPKTLLPALHELLEFAVSKSPDRRFPESLDFGIQYSTDKYCLRCRRLTASRSRPSSWEATIRFP